VRIRLLPVAAALAVLALAGVRAGDPPAVSPHNTAPASGQLDHQPAPNPALPAVASAAITKSASVQSQPAVWPRGFVRPAQRVSTTTVRPTFFAAAAPRPLTFPLLI
jgi:hypothetical protein